MKALRQYAQTHNKLFWAVILGYLVFVGCFGFPLWNESSPLTLDRVFLQLISFGMTGMGFVALLPARRWFAVFSLSLGCAAVGLLFRYLLEYGEVSNKMNFTPLNILLFLTVVPVLCALLYTLVCRCA